MDYSSDKEFKQSVSQHYNGNDLEEMYSTWRRNADYVMHHNLLGLSYTLVMNKFAHLVSKLIK